MACAATVAAAAPAAPSRNPPTRSRSPRIFTQQEMAIKYMGRLESPMPRRMLLTTL